jgi:hypothetical protein
MQDEQRLAGQRAQRPPRGGADHVRDVYNNAWDERTVPENRCGNESREMVSNTFPGTR